MPFIVIQNIMHILPSCNHSVWATRYSAEYFGRTLRPTTTSWLVPFLPLSQAAKPTEPSLPPSLARAAAVGGAAHSINDPSNERAPLFAHLGIKAFPDEDKGKDYKTRGILILDKIEHYLRLLKVQRSAKRYAYLVKQQPGRARQKS